MDNMNKGKNNIGRLQRRIVKRSEVISDLEFDAQSLRHLGHLARDVENDWDLANYYYRQASKVRALIHPLAVDQRLDRELLSAASSAVMLTLAVADTYGCSLEIPGYTLPKEPAYF